MDKRISFHLQCRFPNQPWDDIAGTFNTKNDALYYRDENRDNEQIGREWRAVMRTTEDKEIKS